MIKRIQNQSVIVAVGPGQCMTYLAATDATKSLFDSASWHSFDHQILERDEIPQKPGVYRWLGSIVTDGRPGDEDLWFETESIAPVTVNDFLEFGLVIKDATSGDKD